MTRLLATAAIALLILIAGTAGYLLLADLSHLKRPFLALLSDLIDRELIVDGAFELDLGRQIRVSGFGVRLALRGKRGFGRGFRRERLARIERVSHALTDENEQRQHSCDDYKT